MMSETSHLARVHEFANFANDGASLNEHRKALANAQAQALSLYISTKSCRWYMTGPHRDKYELLLIEQAEQLYEVTNALTERVRTFRSDLTKPCEFANCIRTDDIEASSPDRLLNRLRLDNQILRGALHTAYFLGHGTSSVLDKQYLEAWIHEARARARSLLEATCRA